MLPSGTFQTLQKNVHSSESVAEMQSVIRLYIPDTEKASGSGFQNQATIYWCISGLQI